MKKIIKLLVILFFLNNSTLYSQNNLIEYKKRPSEFENIEKRNDSIFMMKKNVSEKNQLTFQSKLPYPILFIHGLNSSSETWNTTTNYFDSQYSFTFGGRFDFCLNNDNNNTTTNLDCYPTTGADLAMFETSVQNGDYFYLNFNVNPNGSIGTTVLSNQAAVAKQGIAVKKTIQRIIEITGKNKVILVGHSMGGLASREYLQNSNIWQSDNNHHVPKLVCVGTPNGGSNASDSSFAYFTGTDLQSEAIRDLKSTYYYSGEPGRYLFGGTEIQNANNMNDNSYSPHFYNVDINCNGQIGENITGLNQKPIDNYVDYACVIGRITDAFGSNITSDGIVEEPSSNLNHFYPNLQFPAKLYYFNSGYDLIENHTELTSYYYQILQGLDEPCYKEIAYSIDINKTYYGFTTIQNPIGADIDYYKFSIPQSMNASVTISSIVTNNMSASIEDELGNIIGSTQNNSGANINFTRTLNPGNYFLKINSANPTNSNYQTPYQFSISTTLSNENSNFFESTFYPNPVENILYFDNFEAQNATVFTVSGQLVIEKHFDNQKSDNIDLSELKSGVYIIKLKNDTVEKSIKFSKK